MTHVRNFRFAILICMVCPQLASAAENLLGSAELVPEFTPAKQVTTGRQLTDGNLAMPASDSRQPLTLIFEFSDTVSPETLVVHLPAAEGDELMGELELLGSLVSPDSGYQLLRSAGITTRRQKQSFNFQATGIRWLMVRYTSVDEPPQVSMSEIEVSGVMGPPASVYQFDESPAAALEVLATINNSIEVDISPAEKALFEDAADGQLDDWTLAEAALLASGVLNETEREAFLDQINSLEQSFVATHGEGGSPMDTGQKLLSWMHADTMQSGYVSKQTDLSTLLTDHTYNCVSSAVLYNILGRRLGLDVRGVEVPDHAFAVVYQGTDYVDVETTTPQGFNPTRNKKAIEAFQATTGFSYIPDRRPDKRREISSLELVSFIYYNHGVDLAREDDYLGALLANFRALSLDPNSKSAVKNALSALANWSLSLLKAKDYAGSLEIVQLGLTLAPDDRTLNHNHKVIWQRRLESAISDSSFEQFAVLVDEASTALPDADFDAQQSLYFIGPADTFAENGQWQLAIDSITDAMQQVNESSHAALQKYRKNLVIRWSNQEIEAGQWQQALDALAYGYELMPDDRSVARNISYVLQEWSEQVYAELGEAASEEIVVQVSGRFPDLKNVQRAGRSYAIRRIAELRDQGLYADALDLINDYRYLVGSDRDFDTLVRTVFDDQADVYLEQDNWLAAAGVYQKALVSFPDNKQLKQNQEATWDQWARSFMKNGEWSEAINVYDQAILAMPEERSFQKNKRYCAQEWLKQQDPLAPSTAELIASLYERLNDDQKMSKLASSYYLKQIEKQINAGEFQQALQIAEAGAGSVLDEKESLKVQRQPWDLQARQLAKQKNWQEAVDIYQAALEAMPGDSRLTQNAVATWHNWAETYMSEKDWDGAITVYSRGLERMPDTRLFKQNIRYCEQERDSGGESG
jgi:tetratricopeptide (TPR) repeat protein